ncbi:MAG: hypothetical protein SNJ61_12970, partial [Fimbriimonadaceae bacterium]
GRVPAVATYPIESSYAKRARLVQRVQPNPGADLFGDVGTLIGSPQLMIVDDPRAFTGERTADGAALVDDQYLRDNAIYPLQMQTVSYLAGLGRLGGGAGCAAFLVAWVLMRRRASRDVGRAPVS